MEHIPVDGQKDQYDKNNDQNNRFPVVFLSNSYVSGWMKKLE